MRIQKGEDRGGKRDPSCASRFLCVTSPCLAFYLGQTGIRLNALIKLLTSFRRPGGHRVSADEFDLFCPHPTPSAKRRTEQLFLGLPQPLIFVPPFWIAIRILISRSTTCSSGYLPAVELFDADLTTKADSSRGDKFVSMYRLSCGERNRTEYTVYGRPATSLSDFVNDGY